MTTPAAKVKIKAYDETKPAFASVQANLTKTSANAVKTAAALTGIGTAGAVLALVGLTKSAIEYGSALTDAAKATGVGVEALQVLRMMADKAGASHASIEKALIAAQKASVDAADGLTTYSRSFERLNIDVESFIKLPQERKLETIGKAMANAKDKNRAYSDVVAILGKKNAPALMEVLQDLAENGFDAAAESAREMGQIMSEETAQSMDAMADAMATVKREMSNAWAGVVVSVANVIPALNTVNTEIASAGVKVEKWKKAITKFDEGKGMAHFFGTNRRELTLALSNAELLYRSHVRKRDEILAEATGDKTGGGVSGAALEAAEQFGQGYENAMQKATRAQERFEASQRSTAEQTTYLKDRLAGLNEELKELAEDRGEETADYQEKLEEVYKARLALATLEKRSTKEQADAITEWRESNLTAQLMVVNAMKNASNEMTDSFMDFIETGEFEFDNMVSSMLKSLARLAFQQGVANPLMQFASAAIGGLIGTGANTDIGAGTTPGRANYADMMPKYHTGGIVGLQPDEMPAILKKGEEVLTEGDPRHRNNADSGGGAVDVSFNINAIDSQGFAQIVGQNRQLFVSVINDALAQRGRGGI